MNICILGWYGTETLGDRAILEGILQIFEKIDNANKIYLGSLYPFFTERTLFEEEYLLNKLGIKSEIIVFNERKGSQLKNYIRNADFVIMGGGPLMDLIELDIIDAAFSFAKKMKKRTGLIGCGIGPLKKREFRKSVYNIISNSDLCIFRDSNSLETAKILCKRYGSMIKKNCLYSSLDPAILPLQVLNRVEEDNKTNQIVVNYRDLGFQIASQDKIQHVFHKLVDFTRNLSYLYEQVILLPNHTFYVGGDDRYFLSKIKIELTDCTNIVVCQKPKSLLETFSIISCSEAAVAMRYHAILFQTLLNGNNYILDYTDKKTGKINSFLKDIDLDGFYNNRVYDMSSNLQEIRFDFNKKKFVFDKSIYPDTLSFYVKCIEPLLK